MLSDATVYEPQIRARLGTTAHFYEVAVLNFRAVTAPVSQVPFTHVCEHAKYRWRLLTDPDRFLHISVK